MFVIGEYPCQNHWRSLSKRHLKIRFHNTLKVRSCNGNDDVTVAIATNAIFRGTKLRITPQYEMPRLRGITWSSMTWLVYNAAAGGQWKASYRQALLDSSIVMSARKVCLLWRNPSPWMENTGHLVSQGYEKNFVNTLHRYGDFLSRRSLENSLHFHRESYACNRH